MKVLQTGLRRDTRSVEVTIHNGQAAGWQPLTVRAVEGRVFPGWWRRDGEFLLTLAGVEPVPPPLALQNEAVLATARPIHSWMWQSASGP